MVGACCSCRLHCSPSVSSVHPNCVWFSLRSGSPAGPTTNKGCWRKTAQSLDVTGLKGFSWGEKAHIPLSVKQQRSFSWAAIQTDMKLFYFCLPYEQQGRSLEEGSDSVVEHVIVE